MATGGIHFCESSDGVKIAYAVEGTGPPLFYIGLFTYSVTYPKDAVFMRLREGLARERTVVSLDARGIGLSQRDALDLSLDRAVADVEAVAAAAGLDEFDIIAAYDGAHTAIAYVHRHPGRVRRLMLVGLCRSVSRLSPQTIGGLEEFINANWENAMLAMAAIALRNAPGEPLGPLAEAYKTAISREAALKYLVHIRSLDSTDILPLISIPTLVIHWRDDATVPMNEATEAAALIPDARLLVVDSVEPPWSGEPVFLDPMLAFLREGDETGPPAGLTAREVEILGLLAAGRSNQQIANELSISARTAERHIGNIYLKIGAKNRAEATAFALRHGISRTS